MNLLSGQPSLLDQGHPGDGRVMPSAQAHPLPAATSEQAMFRLDLGRSLRLHRSLALFIALLGLAGSAAYLFFMWPIYTAQSLVYLQPGPSSVMDQNGALRWPFDVNTYESFVQQQIQAVTRPDVLLGALKKMDRGAFQKSNESEQAAVERLKKTIEVARLGTSYQISITAHASNAEAAATLANAVTASYIESSTHDAKAGQSERLSMLRDERDRVQNELGADRVEQQALNKQLGVAAVSAVTPDSYDDDISRVREELVKARTLHDEATAKLTTMMAGKSGQNSPIDAEADEQTAGDAGLVSLKTSLNQRRAAITSQMANLTPTNPVYKQDAQELAQINASQDNMAKELRVKAAGRIEQRLRNDLERTSGVESQLNAQLGKMAAAAGSATPKMQRAADLAADITRLQNRYAAVDNVWRNVMLDAAAPGAAYVSSAALPPLHPFKSGVLRNTLLISFAGLFFAIAAAVGAHKMDNRIYIASDVEQVLGFAPLAVLPDFHEVSDGVAEEHFLRLTAGIEYAYQQGNLKSCIFTGAGPGAGVTTVATRVRSMLETMGKGTVLVDASGTPPPPQRTAPGANAHEAARNGARRGSRSTALAQQLAEESETAEQTLVLTDTAPLSVSAETEYLARFVDAAIVVIESGATTRAQLRDTANTLQRLDVSAVGFVLNRVGLEKADPAFRKSVHNIETHLRAQSRSFARRTERSKPAIAASASEPAAEEARAQAEAPAPPPPPAARPVRAAAPPPAPTVAEAFAPAPEPERIPMHMPRAERVEEPLDRAPFPPPSWASRAATQQFEPEPEMAQTTPPPAPRSVAPPPIERPAPAPRAPQPAPAAQASAPPAPPAQSWERLASRFEDLQPEPQAAPPQVEQAPEIEDESYDAASRLSGLRNLLFSLGLKNLNHQRDVQEQAQAEIPQMPPASAAPAYDRPPYGRGYPPPAEPMDFDRGGPPASTLVTAQPEFLPPRPMVEVEAKEPSYNGSTSGRRDRRESYDEVQILPSWRGQYKKKRD